MFYQFENFRLDAKGRRLWSGEDLVTLAPKEFELLVYFVEHPGELAAKNDLLDSIWSDAYVEEATLARNVSWLRDKLDAAAGGKRLIETVPKHGYRFVGDVTQLFENGDALVIDEQARHHIRVEETLSIHATPVAPETKRLTGLRIVSLQRLGFAVVTAIAVAGIGYFGYQNFVKEQRTHAVVAEQVRPLTGTFGREDSPAFSPDGKQIAYAWDGDEGNWDLYVRLVSGSDPLRLTSSEQQEHFPVFSPDGSQIAFVRDNKTFAEIRIMPALGGPDRLVTRVFSNSYSISFSADGQHLAVIDTETSAYGGQYVIYLVNVQSGERRRLTAPGDFVGETTPRFAPDGRSVAFVRLIKDKGMELFVVPSSGGEPRRLTSDEATVHSAAWSPDSQSIYFISLRSSNHANLWRIPAAGGEPEFVSTGSDDLWVVAASPDGKHLAYVTGKPRETIWRVSGSEEKPHRFAMSPSGDQLPRFSPDGTRLVFFSDRSGKYEVWTSNADGKNARQITGVPGQASFDRGHWIPDFSPDGSHITFYNIEGDRSYIYTAPADGGAMRRLTSGDSNVWFPAWSADGNWIYFTSDRSGEYQVWKVPSSGGEAVQVTTTGAIMATPAPDGKTLYFVKWNEHGALWRLSLDTGVEELVADINAAGFTNIWTISKAGICFLTGKVIIGAFDVHPEDVENKFYDFATGRIRDVGGKLDKRLGLVKPCSTVDGNTFLFSATETGTSRIMLVDLPH